MAVYNTDKIAVDAESVLNSQKELAEIDKALLPVNFEEEDKKIINAIVAAENKDELEKQFELFNINQSKKDAIRIIKLQGLLGKVEDQTIERFEKRPDQVSNRELLDYMTIVSQQIDRSQKKIDELPNIGQGIGIKQPTTNVTVNVGPKLTRDDKEQVVGAIKGILDILKNNNTTSLSQPVEKAEFNPTSELTDESKLVTPVSIILETDEK